MKGKGSPANTVELQVGGRDYPSSKWRDYLFRKFPFCHFSSSVKNQAASATSYHACTLQEKRRGGGLCPPLKGEGMHKPHTDDKNAGRF